MILHVSCCTFVLLLQKYEHGHLPARMISWEGVLAMLAYLWWPESEVHIQKGSPDGHKVPFRGMADEHPDADTGDVVFILKELTSSERPSPEPLLKKEASPAVLAGREFWKRSGSLKCLEITGFGGSQPYSREEFQETL